MKKKLTEKYMLVFSISIIFIVTLWVVFTYIFVLSGKVGDNNQPMYLVNRFEQYIVNLNGLKINDEGKKVLVDNNLWAQLVDQNGKVIEECNTPKELPLSYDIFEITNYAMNSNALENQTVFISRFSKFKWYGVIIGCDSSKVSKMSIKFTGGISRSIIKSIIILLLIFVITGIGAGLFFSRNISVPVNEIIENINNLESDKDYKREKNNDKIFNSVFESLDRLQLRLSGADIERKNAEKQRNEWISNISHDMKTPLSTINGYAEIMADDDYEISDEERKKYSEKIVKNVEIIKNLIDELKFGRLLENGEIRLHKEEVNICRFLRECCEDIPQDNEKSHIKFEFQDETIYVMIDRQLMRRCLVNIICNAIIHNNNNVQITIKCYKKDKIIIEIIDNGRGMSKDEIDKVFKRYYRGKTSKESVGSGLGLAIAKEIVEIHNGKVLVESKEGEGSKFILVL